MSDDKHLEALQGIWGEMKILNSRINTTNERIDATNERLDSLGQRVDTGFAEVRAEFRSAVERLEECQTQAEVHIATELVAVRGTVEQLSEHLRTQRDERTRLAALEKRVEKLERKVG